MSRSMIQDWALDDHPMMKFRSAATSEV